MMGPTHPCDECPFGGIKHPAHVQRRGTQSGVGRRCRMAEQVKTRPQVRNSVGVAIREAQVEASRRMEEAIRKVESLEVV